MQQEVILVNEDGEMIGVMEKIEAHQKALLHRAFSIFIFNDKNEMLLQQRAFTKYHSAGLWSNACCSHPSPGETNKSAAARRLFEELGFSTELQEIFSFTYRHAFENGLTEYEFDHIFIGRYNGTIFPDKNEVNEYRSMSMKAIEELIISSPENFTPWFLILFPQIKKWMAAEQQKRFNFFEI